MVIDFQPSMVSTAVQILVFAGAVVASHYALKGKVDIIGVKLSNLESITNNMTTMLTSAAVQSERLSRLEEDIRELRHGKGFVANGEYDSYGKL